MIIDYSENKKKYKKSIELAYKNLDRFDYELNCKEIPYFNKKNLYEIKLFRPTNKISN